MNRTSEAVAAIEEAEDCSTDTKSVGGRPNCNDYAAFFSRRFGTEAVQIEAALSGTIRIAKK